MVGRPSLPELPRGEIRICDICTRIADAVCIAALHASSIRRRLRQDAQGALPPPDRRQRSSRRTGGSPSGAGCSPSSGTWAKAGRRTSKAARFGSSRSSPGAPAPSAAGTRRPGHSPSSTKAADRQNDHSVPPHGGRLGGRGIVLRGRSRAHRNLAGDRVIGLESRARPPRRAAPDPHVLRWELPRSGAMIVTERSTVCRRGSGLADSKPPDGRQQPSTSCCAVSPTRWRDRWAVDEAATRAAVRGAMRLANGASPTPVSRVHALPGSWRSRSLPPDPTAYRVPCPRSHRRDRSASPSDVVGSPLLRSARRYRLQHTGYRPPLNRRRRAGTGCDKTPIRRTSRLRSDRGTRT